MERIVSASTYIIRELIYSSRRGGNIAFTTKLTKNNFQEFKDKLVHHLSSEIGAEVRNNDEVKQRIVSDNNELLIYAKEQKFYIYNYNDVGIIFIRKI